MKQETFILFSVFILYNSLSCNREEDTPAIPVNDSDTKIYHYYTSISDISLSGLWRSHNLHDPAIIKDNGLLQCLNQSGRTGSVKRYYEVSEKIMISKWNNGKIKLNNS